MSKPAQPELQPYRCAHCGATLAQTDGARLILAQACIDRTVILWCTSCGERVTWREAPGKPPLRPCCGYGGSHVRR